MVSQLARKKRGGGRRGRGGGGGQGRGRKLLLRVAPLSVLGGWCFGSMVSLGMLVLEDVVWRGRQAAKQPPVVDDILLFLVCEVFFFSLSPASVLIGYRCARTTTTPGVGLGL